MAGESNLGNLFIAGTWSFIINLLEINNPDVQTDYDATPKILSDAMDRNLYNVNDQVSLKGIIKYLWQAHIITTIESNAECQQISSKVQQRYCEDGSQYWY